MPLALSRCSLALRLTTLRFARNGFQDLPLVEKVVPEPLSLSMLTGLWLLGCATRGTLTTRASLGKPRVRLSAKLA